jgi:lysophospholipase L1-like esterase
MNDNANSSQLNENETETRKEPKNLTRSRKIIFAVLMILIPIILVLLLEGGLRYFQYGGDMDLFVPDDMSALPEYMLNNNFTKRYYFQKGIKTPVPISQRFRAEKDSTTYRIFCLGASTTQGVPYTPNGAFPAQLQNILSTLHPEKRIEVINCGVTAITSHSVLDIMREVLGKYEPDLIVVYSGHNEFYGVLGQASRLSLFDSHFLIQTFLKMQRSRLFLLVRDIVVNLFSKRVSEESVMHHNTMMGIMASNVGIDYNSQLIQRTENHLRKNLEMMSAEAKKHHTDLIFCTLVDNLADLEPFCSQNQNDNATNPADEIVIQAKKQQAQGNYEAAIKLYQQALQTDSTDAGIHYQLAKSCRALNKIELARHHFRLARDFDTIRFRAPSSFNRIIREVAQTHAIPLADVEYAFRKSSPDSLVGNTLILEHVHPNLRGYLLIAQTIAEKMWQEKMIGSDWVWRRKLSLSACWQLNHRSNGKTLCGYQRK